MGRGGCFLFYRKDKAFYSFIDFFLPLLPEIDVSSSINFFFFENVIFEENCEMCQNIRTSRLCQDRNGRIV